MATIITSPKKATFIHIPKNGTTSICQWLHENAECHEVKRRHDSASTLRKNYGDLGWTFCTVRNPWDRLVSIYHYNLQEPADRIKILKECKGEHPKSHKSRWQIDYNQNLIDRMEKTFDEFVLNKSWMDQCLQQDLHQGVDYIMKIENIDSDFVAVQELVGSYKPLPKKNTSKHLNYKELYNSKTKDLVYNFFKSDIELYGYEF